MADAESIYEELGEGRFRSTQLARGPWNPGHQHGGAPTGLIVRQLERVETLQPMRLARITCEILRPVPIGDLTVETEVLRPGKRVQWVGARVSCDGVTVVTAIGLFIRVEAAATPGQDMVGPEGPAPEDSPPAIDGIESLPEMFAGHAVDIRIASGKERWIDPGPGSAWFRLKVPLVAGERPTAQQRAVSAADFGNGISAPLSWHDWLFVNADLSVSLARQPQGEWIRLDSITRLAGDGTGSTESRIADSEGGLGAASQSLYVQAQAGASDFGRPS